MVSLGQEDFIEGARAVKRCHQATRDSRRFRNGAVSISMEAVAMARQRRTQRIRATHDRCSALPRGRARAPIIGGPRL